MEIMSWINVSWHAVLHCTAFDFLEAMNDETPVVGATSWPALLYMMQPAGGPSCSTGVGPAAWCLKRNRSEHWNTEYSNTL